MKMSETWETSGRSGLDDNLAIMPVRTGETQQIGSSEPEEPEPTDLAPNPS